MGYTILDTEGNKLHSTNVNGFSLLSCEERRKEAYKQVSAFIEEYTKHGHKRWQVLYDSSGL